MAVEASRGSQDEETFIEALRSLHEISLQLSASPDLDGLCRRAVEWGMGRLGFDRMSIWFIDPEDSDWNVGSWGTDESGRLRDERGVRVRRDPIIAPPEFYEGKLPVVVSRDLDCFDEKRRVVGRSDKALAPLWDGRRIIGELSADNLLSHKSVGTRDIELLTIYARMVAHLCSLMRTKEALASESLARKTLLLELKHRTKNSISVIASLVGMEAERVRDPDARSAFATLANRVEALGSLYSLIDVEGLTGSVDLKDYLEAIVHHVAASQGTDSRAIAVGTKIESIRVDPKKAAPLGLVLNELLTDCMKYAHPEGGPGRIEVELRLEAPEIRLLVSDDGVGLPPGFAASSSSGLGMGLILLLAQQLGGRFEIGEGTGARFSLRFPQ